MTSIKQCFLFFFFFTRCLRDTWNLAFESVRLLLFFLLTKKQPTNQTETPHIKTTTKKHIISGHGCPSTHALDKKCTLLGHGQFNRLSWAINIWQQREVCVTSCALNRVCMTNQSLKAFLGAWKILQFIDFWRVNGTIVIISSQISSMLHVVKLNLSIHLLLGPHL